MNKASLELCQANPLLTLNRKELIRKATAIVSPNYNYAHGKSRCGAETGAYELVEAKKSKLREVLEDITNLKKKIKDNEESAKKLMNAEGTVNLDKLKELRVSVGFSALVYVDMLTQC